MLTQFTLQNFKALENARLELGRITVLIGPNGTGKSSVLQALSLLKQSLGSSGLAISGESINLGSFADVVHMRDLEADITFSAQVNFVAADVSKLDGKPAIATYDAVFNRNGLDNHTIDHAKPFPLTGSWFRGRDQLIPRMSLASGNEVSFVTTNRVGRVLQAQWSGTPPQNEQAGWNSYIMAIHTALHNVYVVPTVRGWHSPSHTLLDQGSDDFLTAQGPGDYAARVLSGIAYRRELEEEISDFSERVLGVRLRVRLVANKQVLAVAYNGAETNLVNEGFGANQLMVMLAQMMAAGPGSLLGIEEPEIHLYPKAQAALARVFADVAKKGEKQLLLTTHSEHILMGLLTVVAEGGLAPKDIKIYYFERNKQGVTRLENLEIDEHGRLVGGLKGFFEANVAQLDDFLKAQSGGD